MTLLSRAADDAGLPADPEFRAAIMGYAEWGTRLALHNSQPGAEAAPHAPVPRWGWASRPRTRPPSGRGLHSGGVAMLVSKANVVSAPRFCSSCSSPPSGGIVRGGRVAANQTERNKQAR